jgi:hypothetical protein
MGAVVLESDVLWMTRLSQTCDLYVTSFFFESSIVGSGRLV